MTDDNPLARALRDVLNVGIAARDVIARRLPRGPRSVVIYGGFGSAGQVIVHGRALRDDTIPPAGADDSRWENLWAMVRRADADPIPHASVRLTAGSQSVTVSADDEGFFHETIRADDARRIDDEWIEVDADLSASDPADEPAHAAGRVLVPAFTPEFLVISDVDDTVLQSKVTNFLVAARTIAFGNARTRLPFPGVAAFYQALRRGPTQAARNPMFYVSSSPWNLHDVITQFLELQGIPAGPVLLRDLDLNVGVASSRHHHTHKREMIRRVLTMFPQVPAILVGDSGQQDPEIYRDVVREFAGRIKAVYIRNVSRNNERSRAIASLAEEVLAAGSSLVLADDTLAAARHAAEHGFISPAALDAIGEEKKADEGVTGEKQDAPGARDAGDAPTPTVVVEKKS